MYATSAPWSPYSFSTCTIRIGPPFVTCSPDSWRPTACSQFVAGTSQRGSDDRIEIGFFRSPFPVPNSPSPISHHGAPPPSHSAQL